MASIAYFRKEFEDELTISYLYGSERDQMIHKLVLEKDNRKVSPSGDLGYAARKAAAKILRLQEEQGSWPDGGSSVS